MFQRHIQQYFSFIMANSFSGGRSRSIRREPPTMGNQMVSFITTASSAPFLYFTKLAQTYTALVIGLYELLGNATA